MGAHAGVGVTGSGRKSKGTVRAGTVPSLDRTGARDRPELWTARSSGGVVAAAHYLAAEAGAEVLAAGGDAVDAAAAASLALGVVEPFGSGLGGMAAMTLLRADSGAVTWLPGLCRAPRRATAEAVAQAPSRYRGPQAVAVPMLPAVLDVALQRYGRLPLEGVFEPAVRLADEGYPLTPLQAMLAELYRRPLARRNAAALFLDAHGEAPQPGSIRRFPALAATLRRLAREGLRDFYEGGVARAIDDDFRRSGGFLRLDDLAVVEPPREREPLRGSFDDLEVCAPGPPAGGIALLEMLRLVEAVERRIGEPLELDSPAGAVRAARLIRRARLDRRRLRLDVGDETPAGAAVLLTSEYAAERAAELADGAGETSHVSVADARGNLVSLTQSIDRTFGAGFVTPELGFLYNGFLRAFKVGPPEHPHYLRPAAVARSNAVPAILLRDGRGWGAIGSTGSERTASGILATLLRLRAGDAFGAVAGPRLHASPDGQVWLERERFSAQACEALRADGFELRAWNAYSFKAGGLQLVVRDGDAWTGVADPRRDGCAAGVRPGGGAAGSR